MTQHPKNQGEGNREAAKEYNDGVQTHIQKGHVQQEAEAAKKSLDSAEGPALKKAEAVGREKSKGEDPGLYKAGDQTSDTMGKKY